MLFNDYVVNLKKRSSQLERLSKIISELNSILESENELFRKAFKYSYLGFLSPNNSNLYPNCNSLIGSTNLYVENLKHSLISIDFAEFGMVLFEFKSIENNYDYFETQSIFDKMMYSYKIIHNYKTLVDKNELYDNYSECMMAIKDIVDIYNKCLYTSNYVQHINNILCKNIGDEGLEIQLLMSDFHKETYNDVIDPIYDIYNKLCEIANVKEELMIARIETGSFFAKFSGNLAILKLTAKIIGSAHDIFIRNYTREGKKQNIAESVDLFGKQVEIMKTLKELGFRVDEHEEIANETLGLLLKKSSILLSSSPDIRINDKIISRSIKVKELLSQKELKQLAITIDDNLE